LRFVRGREKYNQNGLSGLSNRIAVKMNKIWNALDKLGIGAAKILDTETKIRCDKVIINGWE
jgi:hypothetical protein